MSKTRSTNVPRAEGKCPFLGESRGEMPTVLDSYFRIY